MGFLEDMAGKEVSSMMGSSSNPMLATVMQMINSQPGGLSGLVQQFHDKGLGGLVTSWVSTGQNLPISADQLQHVLGSEQVKELAAKASSALAVLAHIGAAHFTYIDVSTPDRPVSHD